MVLSMTPAKVAIFVVMLVETDRRATQVEDPEVKSRA